MGRFAHVPTRGDLAAIFATLLAIATIVVALRLYARTRRGLELAVDDAVIVLAWMLAAGLFACTAYGVARRVWVRHITELTMTELQEGLKVAYGFTVLYTAAIAAIRSSILLFYRRINPKRGFRRMVWVALAVTICVAVVFTLVVVFQCHPISFNWNKTVPGGHCINQTTMYVIGGSTGVALDIWTLLIPIPMVWQLQMPRRQKLSLTVILTIGFLTCVASAIRLYYIRSVVTDDPLWDSTYACIWTYVEIVLGITCACLPALHSLTSGMRSSSRLGKQGWPSSYLSWSLGRSQRCSRLPGDVEQVGSSRELVDIVELGPDAPKTLLSSNSINLWDVREGSVTAIGSKTMIARQGQVREDRRTGPGGIQVDTSIHVYQ